MNTLTLKWAELLTAWALSSPEEQEEFQKKHGPIMEPPRLMFPINQTTARAMSYEPMTHDAHGPVYYRDLDQNALRDGKLVRKK